MTISFDVTTLTEIGKSFRYISTKPFKNLRTSWGFSREITVTSYLKYFKWITCLVLITLSTSASAIYVSKDGKLSYESSDLAPLLANLRFSLQETTWQGQPGDILISVKSDKYSWIDACTLYLKGPVMTMEQILNQGRPTISELVISNSDKLHFGNALCHKHHNAGNFSAMIQVFSKEREGSNGWFHVATAYKLNIKPSPQPTECTASITGPMAFGIVTRREPHSAESTIRVSCSQNSVINLRVNNGYPFLDPESGTQISFETRGDSLVLPSNMECNKGCSVRVIGEMISAPVSPGTYTWAVPVIVEYK
ncbi:hypothetical protein VCSRO121_0344 [Vibrio cholerae]|nr:hypothetical protein VCSRO121_0344 [Vibrio cholerae]